MPPTKRPRLGNGTNGACQAVHRSRQHTYTHVRMLHWNVSDDCMQFIKGHYKLQSDRHGLDATLTVHVLRTYARKTWTFSPGQDEVHRINALSVFLNEYYRCLFIFLSIIAAAPKKIIFIEETDAGRQKRSDTSCDPGNPGYQNQIFSATTTTAWHTDTHA